ncbi:MAG: lipid-A-disaccharide synthase [Halomonadaceae bacterium]|nr:MAG: lipid-A-disaccharide synthase [Halomonadaceae bacterium]
MAVNYQERPLTIAMVAGETSGDLLGADLMASLRQRYPRARFVGIGGPLMIDLGFHSIVPMERLSVMGLVEVLGRLRELFAIRARIRNYCLINRPDVLIGIDAPDFTLGLEKQVRAAGIPTAHYVSPSVWAWRQGRIHSIARSVDLMLTLFPFEAVFYQEKGVPVRFVGHPLADRIPLEPDQAGARQLLALPEHQPQQRRPIVALLPGSRGGEMGFLGPLFLQAAVEIARQWQQQGGEQPVAPLFLVPCINKARQQQMQELLDASPEVQALNLRLVPGQSREIMAAADLVLLASGTATLEAMLLKRPMVVAYRMTAMSHWLVSRMIKVTHIALPNLLSEEPVVPELIQDDCTPETLAEAAMARLLSDDKVAHEQQVFREIHQRLRRNASERAADAISQLLRGEDLSVPEDD